MKEKFINWFNKPKMSIFFYILACFTLCYMFYTINESYQYIKGLVEAGSITYADSMGDIVKYYISSSVDYLFYSLSFIFFGYVAQFINPKPKKEQLVVVQEDNQEGYFEEDVEEDLEEELEEDLEETLEEVQEETQEETKEEE